MKVQQVIGVGALLGAVLLGAVLLWYTTPEVEPLEGSADPLSAQHTRENQATKSKRLTEEGQDGLPAVEVEHEERPPFSMQAPPGAIGPSTRPFASPEAAASFVEDRVLDLFAAVSPELDPETIHKSCVPDGRTCTFEGPWPGDDFLREWLRAIAEGRTSLAQMDGVRFSEFKPVEVDGQRKFVLTAHAP
jgi:hypothetical protein